MKKYYLCAGFIFALYLGSFAQSNTVSGGGTASGGGGSATYSLGQIDYSNSASATGSIQQGVQQPYEFFEEAGLSDLAEISMVIYPNPSSDWILLTLKEIPSQLFYQLVDAQGKKITYQRITEAATQINVKNLSPGNYHLLINQNDETIQSFKIIKH